MRRAVRILTKRGPAVLAEEACDVISCAFSPCEDQDLVVTVFVHDLLKMFGGPIPLLKVRDDLDNLRDAVVSRQIHRANVDLDVVG